MGAVALETIEGAVARAAATLASAEAYTDSAVAGSGGVPDPSALPDDDFLVTASGLWVAQTPAAARTALGLGALATLSTVTDTEVAAGALSQNRISGLVTDLGNKVATSSVGAASGVASLNSSTIVPGDQLGAQTYASGDYWSPKANWNATQNVSAAQARVSPMFIERTVSIDRLGVDVTTGVAGSSGWIVLFPDLAGRPSPSSITAAAAITPTAAGMTLGTVSVTLKRGWYWIGYHSAVGGPTFRAAQVVTGMPANPLSANDLGCFSDSTAGTSLLTGFPTGATIQNTLGIRAFVRIA